MVELVEYDLRAVGVALRDYLEPLWMRVHESGMQLHKLDWRFGCLDITSAEVGSAASTAMSRHSSEFGRRALAAAGDPRWVVMSGLVPREAMRSIPGYAENMPDGAMHYWLEREPGMFLDITLDQFGLDRIVTESNISPVQNRGLAVVRHLNFIRNTIRCWEGDPTLGGGYKDRDILRIKYCDMVRKISLLRNNKVDVSGEVARSGVREAR